ncbi:MAG TPA: PrsW family glutamic-type intramembrane protease [Candidatus Paceibacterota bacterium]|nr:PrsW family glutamic-type intramembrane protease [Candidatus Paceibacterota bacterium]
MPVPPIAIAILGGILPALLWLWFWLREDSTHPEPRRLIALAFLAGALSIAIVIPTEKFVAGYFALAGAAMFSAWAVIEETGKYLAARLTVLGRRENDEPVDSVIYMVVAALGFSSVENALFLLNPDVAGQLGATVLTGDLRAIGATLLHVLSSSIVGLALAASFYRPRRERVLWAISGVILASVLHAGFNILIINTKDAYLFHTFVFVWIGIVVLLAALEYVKRMRRPVRRR